MLVYTEALLITQYAYQLVAHCLCYQRPVPAGGGGGGGLVDKDCVWVLADPGFQHTLSVIGALSQHLLF